MSPTVTLAQLKTRNTLQHLQTARHRLSEALQTLDDLEPVLRGAIEPGGRRDGSADLAAATAAKTVGQAVLNADLPGLVAAAACIDVALCADATGQDRARERACRRGRTGHGSTRRAAVNFRGASATIRPVLQHVAAQGLTVELVRSGHWRVSDPVTGAFLCALPHTPSSRQAAARANSVLRRAGVTPMPTGHGQRVGGHRGAR